MQMCYCPRSSFKKVTHCSVAASWNNKRIVGNVNSKCPLCDCCYQMRQCNVFHQFQKSVHLANWLLDETASSPSASSFTSRTWKWEIIPLAGVWALGSGQGVYERSCPTCSSLPSALAALLLSFFSSLLCKLGLWLCWFPLLPLPLPPSAVSRGTAATTGAAASCWNRGECVKIRFHVLFDLHEIFGCED